MKLDRYAVAALAGSAALLAGAGVALADGGVASASTCQDRLAKIAERRGLDAQQLRAGLQARLLARIDAAEEAGTITPERAAALRQRVSDGRVCRAIAKHRRAHVAARSMLQAAAGFLGRSREELRAQLPGTSLAALAATQGKSVQALEDAMLAPAKQRLSEAVTEGRLSSERAATTLARLERLAHALANKVFPAR